ncbi:MAG: 50S ribosomal protein L17 [Coriobacteriales bacterium]|nr:50S ribosomal protein L17 [Coriobacteriales bacterium]
MRHRVKGRKLGTDASHTKAMKKSLTCALLANDRIKTTETRAKEIRGEVDRVITWAKRGDVHSRRLAIAKVGDKEVVREVFEKVAQGMYEGRNGGYTRIYKLGNRKGDNAPMVIVELVTEPVTPKKKADEPVKAEESKKPVEIDESLKFDDDDDFDFEDAEEAIEEAAEEAEEAVDEAEEAAE